MKIHPGRCHDTVTKGGDDFDLSGYLKAAKSFIEGHLERWLATIPDTHRIKPAMVYSLMSGGKRMRPILCLAAAQAVDFSEASDPLPEVLDAACAMEMIHTYSLIHDDLPAMDDDALRRGHPTCHLAYDEATAILAGDGLLSLAFQILALSGPSLQTSLENRLAVIEAIARAAGPQGMVEGQMLDLYAEGRTISLDQLKQLHRLKTGALICASLQAGAVLGGASASQQRALNAYGRAVGLAYQVADDILNVEGDPQVLGKAVGTDAQRRKNTYPALLGLSESKALAESLVKDALRALGSFDKKADPLRAIARYIIIRRQ